MSLTTSVSLSEYEDQTLQVIAQQTGQSQDTLLRQAVQRLIAEFQHRPPSPRTVLNRQSW
ncbi:MAG: hypothetical protein M3Q45_13265 [Chloroflexota bacterium]|nr:hypothetical protein [Chloroflexota bacterium]